MVFFEVTARRSVRASVVLRHTDKETRHERCYFDDEACDNNNPGD